MVHKHHPASETLAGKFQYPIYSPAGGIEGALMLVGEEPVQLVFDKELESEALSLAALSVDAPITVVAHAEPPSDKGEAPHRVLRFERLVSVHGRKTTKPAAATSFSGVVVRVNFARHGEANGVVLDTGDFIHLKPHGMTDLAVAIGDHVEAEGRARPLVTGGGQAVEATVVNGKALTHKH